MLDQPFKITSEDVSHSHAVETLLDTAFGPGRFAKTAYRLREGVEAVPGLSFTGFLDNELIATIRFWPVKIGDDCQALMLGPLAIKPGQQGKGWGVSMIKMGLVRAKELDFSLVVLVGDEDYYARCGFKRAPHGKLNMPGPCDPQRLLYCELEPGAFEAVEGEISHGA